MLSAPVLNIEFKSTGNFWWCSLQISVKRHPSHPFLFKVERSKPPNQIKAKPDTARYKTILNHSKTSKEVEDGRNWIKFDESGWKWMWSQIQPLLWYPRSFCHRRSLAFCAMWSSPNLFAGSLWCLSGFCWKWLNVPCFDSQWQKPLSGDKLWGKFDQVARLEVFSPVCPQWAAMEGIRRTVTVPGDFFPLEALPHGPFFLTPIL